MTVDASRAKGRPATPYAAVVSYFRRDVLRLDTVSYRQLDQVRTYPDSQVLDSDVTRNPKDTTVEDSRVTRVLVSMRVGGFDVFELLFILGRVRVHFVRTD